MYKNRQLKCMLAILVLLMFILSFKFISVKNKLISIKDNEINNSGKPRNIAIVERFGYSDILECLNKNKYFIVESINMMENEKCSVEVNYNGDLNLLYNSLVELYKSKNLINVNKIIIHKDTKITNIGINFRKNK